MPDSTSRSMVRLRLGSILLATTAVCTPPAVQAAGFALQEQSASGTGLAYAGSGASADDASALFFNPANLSLMKSTQFAIAGHAINLQTDFQDNGSTLPAGGLGALPIGDTQDDAGDLVGLPNLYLAVPVGARLAFGLGVNVPFGLVTEYDDPWIGRFQGIRSELETVNVNPAVSIKITENFAFGAGFNYQYATAELSNAVILGPATEGRALVDVEDEAYGWNAGALVTLPTTTRVGLSYRSKLNYTLEGDTTVTTLGGVPVAAASGPTNVDITFPDSGLLSLVHPLNEGSDIRLDVQWTNWDQVDTISAVNPANGLPRDILQFQFEDSWRAALGVSAKQSEQWTLRGGIAWDQSPVKSDVRTVRLPDSDRWWVSIGARWQPIKPLSVDVGYAHLFVKDASVNIARAQLGSPAPLVTSTVIGDYDSSVDLLSLQLNWSFGG
jgi:long-chain fatty acid transport protein